MANRSPIQFLIRQSLLFLHLLLVPALLLAQSATFDEIKVTTSTLPVHGPFDAGFESRKASPQEPLQPPDPPESGGAIVAHPGPLAFHKKLETFDVTGWGLGARDLSIAASHTHLVLTSSHHIAFATKSGTLLKSIDTVDFFSNAKTDMNKVLKDPVDPGPLKYPIDEFYDARLLFDTYRNRFWIECLVRNMNSNNPPEKTKHRITLTAIAVSKTENPMDGFFLYWWGSGNGTPPEGARDYQNLGISEKLLVVGRYTDEVPVAQADPMAVGSRIQPPVKLLKNINGKGTINLAAVLHYGSSPLGRQFLVSCPGYDRVIVWVLNPQDLGTLLRAEVPLQLSESPAWAHQKSHAEVPKPPLLHPGLTLTQKAVYREGKLYATWPVGRKGWDFRWGSFIEPLSSVQIVRLDVSGIPGPIPTGPGSGKIDRIFGWRNLSDPAGEVFSYLWPTFDVAEDGTMAFAFIRSGTSIYPEIHYSLYRAKDSDISPSTLLHEGEYPLTFDGTLDYTGSAVDPADGRTVYTFNAYGARQASGIGQYKLIVGKIWTQPTL